MCLLTLEIFEMSTTVVLTALTHQALGLHREWNDPEYADTFPPAETVFIVTSAGKSQVESWLTGLETDGALQRWPHGKPKNIPDPARGHEVYWVSWD